jgi:hypothetical protein
MNKCKIMSECTYMSDMAIETMVDNKPQRMADGLEANCN